MDNPLIVHISHVDMLKDLVSEIPPTARQLMDRFWPGPLTILFKKNPQVRLTFQNCPYIAILLEKEIIFLKKNRVIIIASRTK